MNPSVAARRSQASQWGTVLASIGTKSFDRGALIRVSEFNDVDVLRGKRGVVVEEYHQFSVVEQERGDERRKD